MRHSCNRPMIATFDISRISTTVRRHEALLRYARYLFIFNIVIFLWVGIPQLSQVTSFRGLTELVVGPAWQWAALVLGSVGATYLILAHRLWWAYAVIFLVQVGYFVFMPSPDKQVFLVSAFAAYGVITLPPMRPLAPLATELAIMNIGFGYIMIVCCLYSTTWSVNGGRVPPGAYGRRLSPFEPLRPSRLLDTLLPGHRSQNVTLVEAALFALSSTLFVADDGRPAVPGVRARGSSGAARPSDDCLLGGILSLGPCCDRPGSAARHHRCLPRSREPSAPLRQATFHPTTR